MATQRVLQAASGILQAVTDAETAQRGYLLTRGDAFLGAYGDARRRAGLAAAQLTGAATPQSGYSAAALRLRDLAARRLADIDGTLELDRSGHRPEALRDLAEGRALMDEMRAAVDSLTAEAERGRGRLRIERDRFERRTRALQAGLVTTSILALLYAVTALIVERFAARRTADLQMQLATDLEAARESAEDADRAKSRFLAAASHDMRQPLHAMALYISALERRVESEQAREILANMDSAVRAMTRLFTALLDMARLEAGVLKPEPLDFSIGELLQEVADHSLDVRGRKDVKVTVAPTTVQVRTDPDLLEIALRNLASNALKHSRGGRVLLGCRRVGEAVRIEVRDDGEGIAADELQGLFSEFVRGARAGGTEGVGLGLAIVDRMTRLLGHELTARSTLGRGSVFAITVPRARDRIAPRPAGEDARAAPTLKDARILIADDEPLALDAMRRALSDAGAEVVAAGSGAAVEALAGRPFDLYVFDLNLGGDDGLGLLDEVERRRGGPAAALLVTGATTRDALARLRNSGRAWLTKPLAAAELISAAARLLPRA